MGFFLQLLGVLFAPSSPKNWKDFNDVVKFIEFEHVTGLYIRGFGLIDGRGKGWWDISCRYHPDLKVHQILFLSPQAYIVIRNSDFPAIYTFGNFKISSKLFFTQKKFNKVTFSTGLWQSCTYGMFKAVYYYYYY